MGGAAKTNLVNYQGRVQGIGKGQRGQCPGPRPVKGGPSFHTFQILNSRVKNIKNIGLLTEVRMKNLFRMLIAHSS